MRWRASIPRSSTPGATASEPAAGRIPSTSVVSPRSCEPRGVGGLGTARARRAYERRASARASDALVVSQQISSTPRVLTALPLAIDPDEVLRFQGYQKSVDTPGAEVLALFDDALALGRGLITPRAVVRWLAVTRQGADTIDAGGVTLTIPDVGRLWGPVEWVAAAVCTIGDGLERRVGELWEARELPLAAMLDSVGSGAVESLAEDVHDVCCQEAIPASR